MNTRRFGMAMVMLVLVTVGSTGFGGQRSPRLVARAATPGRSAGALAIRGVRGQQVAECPLKGTEVEADVAGFVARVKVRQTFQNPLDQKIEAVYTFPLPQDSAVDHMVMIVGNRRVIGVVKEKQQARQTYEAAKAAGQVASLLDQERPNIFTQSVANIEPGAQVVIEISYVETLKYEDGVFEWVLPMVVGPRYMPGSATGKEGTGWSPDTNQVPDASKISPPTPPPAMRPGHDIKLTVHLSTGLPLVDLESKLHAVNAERLAPDRAVVTLRDENEIPNRDFILRYRLSSDRIGDALFLHHDPRGTFFTLILQPPRRVIPAQAVPKEMVFVIDRSGSMSGFPIEKAKETMRLCIEQMNPRDTFNLLSFDGGTGTCFSQPVPNTPENRDNALKYLKDLYGSGGTEMMPAVRQALSGDPGPGRVRIVCFMTDGYIGNDMAIIDAVKQHAGTARVFSFGIGQSVNRFLLDGMAHAGRGEVEYVTLESKGSEAARRFHQRIMAPVLTNIQIDWGRLPVTEVYPRRIPDLFSAKPIMMHGRLNGPTEGEITLRGDTATGRFSRRIRVTPGDGEPHDALASLWARSKVTDLMNQDLAAMQRGQFPDELKKQIIDLGVQFQLMTQFTSFVAVLDKSYTGPTPPKQVAVPVHLPQGVKYEGVFGDPVVARPGDPLIRIQAPADARQVIALMPGGEIKRLAYNRQTREWETRFDIPAYASEGDYVVTVIVIRDDGTRSVLTLKYRVDMTAPAGAGAARMASSGLLALELETGDDTARVSAILPWGARLELAKSAESGRFFASVPVPHGVATASVTFIVTDRAHNRTVVTVDTSVP